MKETTATQLARLEEQVKSHARRSEERHEELKGIISPLVATVAKHHTLHALNKNDKKWMYGISAFVGALGAALVKYLPHS